MDTDSGDVMKAAKRVRRLDGNENFSGEQIHSSGGR